MPPLIWALALLFATVAVFWYSALIFNDLVSLQNEVERAWANIDVLLKQRHDELPNVVEACRGYMKHEREVLEEVAQARALFSEVAGPRQQALADQRTRAATQTLLAVAENYPDLKANQTFQWLQKRITELEIAIADRREFYNQCVRSYNTRLNTIPDIIVASVLQFRPRELFKVDDPAELRAVSTVAQRGA